MEERAKGERRLTVSPSSFSFSFSAKENFPSFFLFFFFFGVSARNKPEEFFKAGEKGEGKRGRCVCRPQPETYDLHLHHC